MEFCEGGSLDSYIKGKKLTEKQAKRCLGHLSEALNYLFERRIVHRDLKPQVGFTFFSFFFLFFRPFVLNKRQNILLSSSDIDTATLKLCGARHFTFLSSFFCFFRLIFLFFFLPSLDFGFSRKFEAETNALMESHPCTPLYAVTSTFSLFC
jgi:serine/threonine protein kinase